MTRSTSSWTRAPSRRASVLVVIACTSRARQPTRPETRRWQEISPKGPSKRAMDRLAPACSRPVATLLLRPERPSRRPRQRHPPLLQNHLHSSLPRQKTRSRVLLQHPRSTCCRKHRSRRQKKRSRALRRRSPSTNQRRGRQRQLRSLKRPLCYTSKSIHPHPRL